MLTISFEPSATPPLFRFQEESGKPIRLLEVRVTKVGEPDPAWWLVHEDGILTEGATLNIVTREEAERANPALVRSIDNDLAMVAKWIEAVGVPVSTLQYGEVPVGFRQHGPLRPLQKNRVYQIIVMGNSSAELEFYG
jgi:hypothetical protein